MFERIGMNNYCPFFREVVETITTSFLFVTKKYTFIVCFSKSKTEIFMLNSLIIPALDYSQNLVRIV